MKSTEKRLKLVEIGHQLIYVQYIIFCAYMEYS